MRSDYDTLRLGCGEDTRPDQWNVDLYDVAGVDETQDLNDRPWPWDDGEWSHIVAEHVFEHLESMRGALAESERVLERGGTLRVALPMGRDAYADGTHLWGERHLPWTWRTPEFYHGERHWDGNLNLRVTDRRVNVWSVHPIRWVRGLQQWYWRQKLSRYGPGEWCFELAPMCGEFTVVFEK